MSMVFSCFHSSLGCFPFSEIDTSIRCDFFCLGKRKKNGTNKTLIKRPYAFLCTLLYSLLCVYVVLTLFFSLLDNISFSWCAFVLFCGKCGYLRCNFGIAFKTCIFQTNSVTRTQLQSHLWLPYMCVGTSKFVTLQWDKKIYPMYYYWIFVLPSAKMEKNGRILVRLAKLAPRFFSSFEFKVFVCGGVLALKQEIFSFHTEQANTNKKKTMTKIGQLKNDVADTNSVCGSRKQIWGKKHSRE